MSNSNSGSEKLRISCEACGKAFKVPASKAGKSGPCPNCGERITIPLPEPVVPAGEIDWRLVDPGLDQPPATGTEDDAGYDLAEPEEMPQTVRRPMAPPPVTIPGAAPGARMTPGQAAGLNTVNYRGPTPASDATDPGTGRFILGMTLATVFGGVCLVIWVVLWAFVGQFGILAIALGAAIGAGMLLGYGTQSPKGGVAAACIALFTIFLTKAIPAALLAFGGWALSAGSAAMITPYTPASARAELPDLLVDDLVRADGLDYATTSEDEDADYYTVAQEQVAAMDEATLELTFKRQQVANCLMFDAMGSAFSNIDMDDEDAELDPIDFDAIDRQVAGMDLTACDTYLANYGGVQMGPGFWGWFGDFLHPLDALWLLLAVGAAWKIASPQ